MKKLLLFLTLLIVCVSANAQFSPSNNLNYIKLLKTPPIGSVEDSVMVYDSSSSFVKMLPKSSIVAGHELKSNKQNSLAIDGTGTKYPTVDAVNTGLGLKENILNNPITGVGSQNNANTYALQDGTILYHSTKWFVPTSTVSTSGTTVTSVGTQFTSAMVEAKLIINGEWRIITAYTNATNVTVASAYSANYSGVVAGSWGVYSKSYESTSTGVTRLVNNVGAQRLILSGNTVSSFNFASGGGGYSLFDANVQFGATTPIQWGSGGFFTTKDLGLRRNNAGVLEIYDGITATGLEANRRDLLARNLFGSKVLIGSIVDDNVNQGQYTGTVSSGTTALNNTPPIANNQLTRKDYVDTKLALKANLASPSLTGTPTAPTAAAGTNTTQIATTAFVAGGLATKENSFAKNTAFNKNFGTTAGTVVEGGTLGSNAYSSTAYLPLSGGDLSGLLKITRVGSQLSLTGSDQGAIDLYKSGTLGHRLFSDTNSFGIYDLAANVTIFSISKSTGAANFSSSVTATSFNGSATLTGTPTAPTAPAGTNTTQIATTAFVQANARPYKVYTALLSQSGTDAPVAIVLENTLGGTVVWSRSNTGKYLGTLTGAFTEDKTISFFQSGSSNSGYAYTYSSYKDSNNSVRLYAMSSGNYADQIIAGQIEIRVYL